MIPASLLGLTGAGDRAARLDPLDPAQLSTPLPTRRVEVNGLGLNTLDSGEEGRPAVVLIHGMGSNLGFWHKQVPWLRALGLRVLALDLPGYGGSDKPDAPCSPKWYAEQLVGWLDALAVPRAAVIGHSMGGQTAMELALLAPERVAALVLAAPAGIEVFSEAGAAFMRGYWHERRALEASPVEIEANFKKLAFNVHDEHVERLLIERLRAQRHPSFVHTSRTVSRNIAGMLDHPVAPRLAELSTPTLIVWGEDDRMIPNPMFTGGSTAELASRGRRLFPAARAVLIPGAGHFVHHDAPEQFHDAAGDFLTRHLRRR
ncbi:MAG: alpha/beta fold hydrolase [Deltaproteobacteria bacterium]|nr:alpha/beta fold hydrolase [Deltaproteobacteria bacterium]MBK9366901.1 alpha/beta fold hydrolase [Deltaproteobacteria bacterium]